MNKPYTLPVTRTDLFKAAYRMDLMVLIRLSLLISLFFIPLFCFVTADGYFERAVMSQIAASSAPSDFSPLLKLRIYMDLLYIPCFSVGSLGLSGAFNYLKRYSFNEGAVLKRDFWGGIKSNWKESLAVSFFYSALFYLLMFSLNYLSILNFSYYVVLSVFCWVFVLLILVQVLFAFTQIPIYTNGFGMIIKTSFFFACSRLFKGLLVALLTFLPLIIVPFFGNQIADYILILLYIFLGFSNATLIVTLFCEDSFDALVNKKQFPSIYKKGLFTSPIPLDEEDNFLKDLDYE